ncbi:hypothetical protein B0H16DRAFT_1849749 [Mycena metata]|uniref:Uncharacterized protein n=1 Tax=Mycena metata TaxID=1033252 RepID=A0AAD7ISK7_9AGAR|nr:hypothetical protein B0H16DRAFT_1849749 [Mycena metata]
MKAKAHSTRSWVELGIQRYLALISISIPALLAPAPSRPECFVPFNLQSPSRPQDLKLSKPCFNKGYADRVIEIAVSVPYLQIRFNYCYSNVAMAFKFNCITVYYIHSSPSRCNSRLNTQPNVDSAPLPTIPGLNLIPCFELPDRRFSKPRRFSIQFDPTQSWLTRIKVPQVGRGGYGYATMGGEEGGREREGEGEREGGQVRECAAAPIRRVLYIMRPAQTRSACAHVCVGARGESTRTTNAWQRHPHAHGVRAERGRECAHSPSARDSARGEVGTRAEKRAATEGDGREGRGWEGRAWDRDGTAGSRGERMCAVRGLEAHGGSSAPTRRAAAVRQRGAGTGVDSPAGAPWSGEEDGKRMTRHKYEARGSGLRTHTEFAPRAGASARSRHPIHGAGCTRHGAGALCGGVHEGGKEGGDGGRWDEGMCDGNDANAGRQARGWAMGTGRERDGNKGRGWGWGDGMGRGGSCGERRLEAHCVVAHRGAGAGTRVNSTAAAPARDVGLQEDEEGVQGQRNVGKGMSDTADDSAGDGSARFSGGSSYGIRAWDSTRREPRAVR